MVSMKMDKRTVNSMRGVIGRYDFEVGILNDKPHKGASREHTTLAGRVRSKVGKGSDKSISEVSRDARLQTGVNFYTRPMEERGNRDILEMLRVFFAVIKGRGTTTRLRNTLQAVVRNPITRGDYGSNTELTQKIKGFDWLLVHSGQLFNAIEAKVRRRSVPK